AVFSRQNPFPPDPPLSKTHYNPSRAKTLPRPERRTLAASNRLLPAGPPAADPQPSFSESWPSTDLGSPQGADCAPSPGADASPPAAPAGKPQAWAGPVGPREDSVLARYVERFRRGRPLSREERRRSATSEGEGARFWWLPASPPSSSPPALTSEAPRRPAGRRGPSLPLPPAPRRGPGSAPLSPRPEPLWTSAPRDPEILRLQERARRLVQRSSSSIPTLSLPFSHSRSPSLSLSSPGSHYFHPPLSTFLSPSLSCVEGLVTLAALPRPSAGGRPRPEDDILFQWRLRR
uniref:Proline and serine rich 3 n=1 Tax=Lepisosteus oculatus TaxID=7918 RepID=W5M8Y0_LEPOC